MSGILTDNIGRSSGLVKAAGGGAWNLIGTQVASTSANLTQTGLDSTYDTYVVALSDLIPSSDNQDPYLRLGDSSGIDSGSTDYAYGWSGYNVNDTSHSIVGINDTQNSEISFSNSCCIMNGVGNASGEGISGMFYIGQPGDSTMKTTIQGDATFMDSTGVPVSVFNVTGIRNSVITHDRVQFLFASGNIATGRMTVWGIAHA